MGLENRTVLVTGGGTGIGRAIALAAARAGAAIAVAARRTALLEKTAAEIRALGRAALAVPLDLTDPASVRECVARVDRELGRVDVLVNNAAAFAHRRIVDLSVEDWDRVVSTNLRGVFLMCREVLPQMIARREGDIVMVSSTSGKRGNAELAAYAASKHGLNGFTHALLYEARPHGVRVITVSPSAVETPEKGAMRPHRLQAPDVAAAVVAALSLPARALVRDVELWATNP